MFYALLGIMLTVIILLWIIEQQRRKILWVMIPVFVTLAIIAIVRPAGFDRDYNSYVELFYRENAYVTLEPTFRLISSAIHLLPGSNPLYLFAIYAVLGVALKMRGILLMSNDKLASTAIFISNAYFYLDLTQIRSSIAIAIYFLCVYYIVQRRRMFAAALFVLSVLFHYEMLVGIPILFLDPKKIKRRVYIGLIVAAYLLAWRGIGLNGILDEIQQRIGFLEYRINANATVIELTEAVPVKIFNWLQITHVMLACLLLYRMRDVERINPYVVLIVKLYIGSIIFLVLFAENGIYAFRLSQLFAYGEIFLIPIALTLLRNRLLTLLAVSAYASFMFWYNVWFVKLFTFGV